MRCYPGHYTCEDDRELDDGAAREHFLITAGDSETGFKRMTDFDDWVDADEDCTVSHKDKVKIVLSECQVGEQILLEFAAAWLHPRLYPSLVRATRLCSVFCADNCKKHSFRYFHCF